jgi:hypothetical protein
VRQLDCLMTPPYLDRRERRLREFDFRRGCRVKVVSQGKTAAVDHQHPLRPLAPLGFSDSAAHFFAGAKLPSRNDSLHFNCWRWFNSLRNARQISTKRPAPPSLAAAASTSKDVGISLVGPASEPRSAESTKSLPAPDRSGSTDDRPCVVWAAWGARARFSSTALRSATDKRTRPRHRPSFGAADLAYLPFS